MKKWERINTVLIAINNLGGEATTNRIVDELRRMSIYGIEPQALSLFIRFNLEHKFLQKIRIGNGHVKWKVKGFRRART